MTPGAIFQYSLAVAAGLVFIGVALFVIAYFYYIIQEVKK